MKTYSKLKVPTSVVDAILQQLQRIDEECDLAGKPDSYVNSYTDDEGRIVFHGPIVLEPDPSLGVLQSLDPGPNGEDDRLYLVSTVVVDDEWDLPQHHYVVRSGSGEEAVAGVRDCFEISDDTLFDVIPLIVPGQHGILYHFEQ